MTGFVSRTPPIPYGACMRFGRRVLPARHPAVLAGAVLVIAAAGAVFTAPDDYPVTAVLLLPLGAAAVFGRRATAMLSAVAVAGGTILAVDTFEGAALAFRLLFLVAGAATIVLLAAGREARERALMRTEELRAVEDELRASEQRYRSVLEATTSLVAVTDPEGRFVAPQAAWEAFTGQTPDEYRDLGWLDAFHPDDREQLLATFLAGPHPDIVYDNRLRLWHAKSNGYRYVVGRGAAVVDGEQIREWIGTITDVHEAAVAEIRRADAAQLRTAVLSSLQDGLFVAARDGTVIELNDAWERITGFSRSEALRARPPYPWWPDEHEHPDEWRALNELTEHLRTHVDPVEWEVSYRHRDGHLVPTITSVAAVRESGEVRLVIGSVKDITYRKASEEELRAERDFREAIVAALQEGMLVCTPSGAVLEVNDAWTRITGFARDEIVGMTPPFPWWPADERERAALMRDMEHAVRGEPAVDAEVTIARADGERRLVVINRHAVIDPATGNFIAVVSTFRDITRRAAAEARLRTLASLSTRLASCNDVAGVADATLGELMHAMGADAGAVALVDTEARVFGVVGAVGLPNATTRWTRVSLDHPGPLSVSADTQATIVVRDREELERRFPAIAQGTAERGIEAFVTLPLVRANESLGVLFFGFRSAHTLSAGDGQLLDGATSIVAQALERARLFDFQRSVASTLQHAMLSEPPLGTPGVVIATRYQPAESALEVGGDWFDVVALAEDRVGIAAGDIVGRGLAAAAVMGQLRSALGALAHTTPSAGDALCRLDRFARSIPGAKATTVCYGIVDVAARTLRYSAAGHPPPLLIEPGGESRFLDAARGWPLGVGDPAAERPETVVTMPPGSTLILYTDGLVERRGQRFESGMARLAVEASRCAHLPVEELCDEMLAALVPEQPTDDIALVALRLASDSVAAFTCRAPATPVELATIRRQLRAWLERQEVPARSSDDVVLAVGEACTNAVEHAYSSATPTTVVVEAHCLDGEVVLTVRDYGAWRPLAPDPRRNRGLRLIAAVMDDVSVEAGADGGTRVRMRRKLAPA